MKGEGEGFLVVSEPWPGMARTLFRDHRRFEETYFAPFPGYYFTGDWARRDADGGLTVLGRVDDMLNVSGHLLSTSEIESALAEHPAVAEAAAVPIPHRVKGEALFCFVTLKGVFVEKEDMVAELKGKGLFFGGIEKLTLIFSDFSIFFHSSGKNWRLCSSGYNQDLFRSAKNQIRKGDAAGVATYCYWRIDIW